LVIAKALAEKIGRYDFTALPDWHEPEQGFGILIPLRCRRRPVEDRDLLLRLAAIVQGHEQSDIVQLMPWAFKPDV